MAGILSKGIMLQTSSATATVASLTYSDFDFATGGIANIQQIPSLGGDPEQVDVTVLANENFTYIPGLRNFGELEFTLLFDNNGSGSNFRDLKAIENVDQAWCVEFPDKGSGSHGTLFFFRGKGIVSTDEVGVNAAITFKLKIFLSSDLVVVDPA